MIILENLRTPAGAAHAPIRLGAAPPHQALDLAGALVFPGLVNSHDHLEFNSFPALGGKRYPNYVAWGQHIHARYKPDIDRVLRIPLRLRAAWGVYKNLLAGVTTVVHHGPPMPIYDDSVFKNCQSIHSVQLEPLWRLRLNNPQKRPCVIHTGEGADQASHREIDRLTRWNLFHRPLVGVHGIAMTPEQSEKFRALVWCPGSNIFLYGQTARVDRLQTTLLFGTDSTLTGSWNFWDHLRTARETALIPDASLFDALTTNAARIWGLPTGADYTIARAASGWDAFFALDPEAIELVVNQGRVRLVDERWKRPLENLGHSFEGWSHVRLGDSNKYVPGDLPKLAREILAYDPQVIFPFKDPK